jgi:hypothetical protein
MVEHLSSTCGALSSNPSITHTHTHTHTHTQRTYLSKLCFMNWIAPHQKGFGAPKMESREKALLG